MAKISCFLDHAMKPDPGTDAGVLSKIMSSMSLDSSDSSYGSSGSDILNRARMDSLDSMDGELSIKEELNRARILSQDFTLDGIDLSADDDVGATCINVTIKLTDGKPARNTANAVRTNKYAKCSKPDNGKDCRQFVNKKQIPYTYGIKKSTDQLTKSKPLSSPIKNNCASYNSPNNTTRVGPKKMNTRKKRTSRNSVSPPKRYQVANLTRNLNKVSSCSPGVKYPIKSLNFNSSLKGSAKYSEANSKSSPALSLCSDIRKQSPYSKEDSIYSTPLQTPSKLHRLAASPLMSPNVTTRSSPREKIPNSEFVTVRSTPSPKRIPSSCSPSCPNSTLNCSWYSANDSSESLLQELDSSYCHSSPSGKLYFSPLFDDSAIVEASCFGKKYFNYPEAVNLEKVWAGQELRSAAMEERNSSLNNVGSNHPVREGKEAGNSQIASIMDNSLLGERLGKVLNVSVSTSCDQSSNEQSYINFQKFLDRIEGITKVREKKMSLLSFDDSDSPRNRSASLLCCDSRLPDEMSEAELDEITRMHTTCNGQQIASRYFFGDRSNDSFTFFPPPKSPRHLKWSDNLVQVEFDNTDTKKPPRTPLKSILKKRLDNFVFPFNGDEPSPYLITRTRQIYSAV